MNSTKEGAVCAFGRAVIFFFFVGGFFASQGKKPTKRVDIVLP
jgi:hypothetical protein